MFVEIELKIEVIHAAAKLVDALGDDLEPSIFGLEERLPRICKDFNVVMSVSVYFPNKTSFQLCIYSHQKYQTFLEMLTFFSFHFS